MFRAPIRFGAIKGRPSGERCLLQRACQCLDPEQVLRQFDGHVWEQSDALADLKKLIGNALEGIRSIERPLKPIRFCTVPKLRNRSINPQLRFGSGALNPLLHENGVVKSETAVFAILPSNLSLDAEAAATKLRFLPLLGEVMTFEESSVD